MYRYFFDGLVLKFIKYLFSFPNYPILISCHVGVFNPGTVEYFLRDQEGI